MMDQLQYQFAGTDGFVDLSGCSELTDILPRVFPKWPYKEVSNAPETSIELFKVRRGPDHYTLSSPVFDTSQNQNDPLNLTCSLVAELAWAQLRHRPEMLCFHGAAIEVNGGLVLFPNRKRAGKSTLTACLAARGYRVYTDDYLPIEIDAQGVVYGYANGAAPRLRLPLPAEFSPALTAFLKSVSGPANTQYLYLDLPDTVLARHGERLPVSHIVMLDRQNGSDIELTKASAPEILRRVILQNFSRQMNPARILSIMDHLVNCTEGLNLRYDRAESAANLLGEHFGEFPRFNARKAYEVVPELVPAALCDAPCSLPFEPCRDYVRSDHAVEKNYGSDSFVASSQGLRIHHLNRMASAIWTILQEPSKLDDIVEIFSSAFPDIAPGSLCRDISKIMAGFAKDGLLDPVAKGET